MDESDGEFPLTTGLMINGANVPLIAAEDEGTPKRPEAAAEGEVVSFRSEN